MSAEAAAAPLRICILTAGVGSRMGPYATITNKALLPMGPQAVISHLLEKFPAHYEVVVAIGHLGEDVKAYLELAHPERTFHFVHVDHFQGPGSGPGYSLTRCRAQLPGAFFYVSCDTLWEEPFDLTPAPENWFAAAPAPPGESARYCNFRVAGDRILSIHDKQPCESADCLAFTGIGFIRDSAVFWKGLASSTRIEGEHQVSGGIQALVEGGNTLVRPMSWIDVGDERKYRAAQSRLSSDFDFSKTDEFIYQVRGRVVKFFAERDSAQKRFARARSLPAVFPRQIAERPGWYAYERVHGKSLYQECDLATFSRLLDWLQRSLWHAAAVPPELAQAASLDFYRDKTLRRISQYRRKQGIVDSPAVINGEAVPALDDLLAKVPWELLGKCVPVIFHGDLHFEHVLREDENGDFRLIDWRHDFAGHVDFGDLYYDYAKLMGGFVMNYDYIKRGLFTYSSAGGEEFYDYAARASGPDYQRCLRDFIAARGHDPAKVDLIVALIFLNMSPLHHEPWDKLLYALGRRRLKQALAMLLGERCFGK